MTAIRIVVADDHPVLRSGLHGLLDAEPDMVVCGEAASYPDMHAVVAREAPAVVLMDLRMPGGAALDAVPRLRRDHPAVSIIVFSSYSEDAMLLRMLQAGAAGYLQKDATPAQILAAIRAVAAGRTWVSDSGAQAMARALQPGAPHRDHAALSPREFQVLRMLGSGVAAGAIAEQLHVSVKTVSTYRRRLMLKMGFTTTADIIRYTLDHGLID